MSAATRIQAEDRWNPAPKGLTVRSYLLFGAWTVVQPLIDGVLRNPFVLSLVVWLFGLVVIAGMIAARRYSLAKPYRELLESARGRHPGAVVFGLRLDPVATPMGTDWADSRFIQWGLITASPAGIEIVRSDGFTMLARPWSEVELAVAYRPCLYIRTVETNEEWWIPLMSDSGIWPLSLSRRSAAKRIRAMLVVRSGVGSTADPV